MKPTSSSSAARVAAAFLSPSRANPPTDAIPEGGLRLVSEAKCVVCGAPGEVIRFIVRGADRTELAGRVFPKTSVLCARHAAMCEGA